VTPPDGQSVGTRGNPSPRSPIGRVTVGGYVLKLGTPGGTAIVEAAEKEGDGAQPLQRALKKDKASAPKPEDEAIAAAATNLVGQASEVTSKAERAVTLFTELAEGRLDPKAVSDEIGALVDLLQRLDREGRWSEALSLARALAGLLALLMRWVDLVRSLEVAVRAAGELGDFEAAGWATHELGTLHLGAGNASRAEERLGEAQEIRRRVGDREGLAATEHNLQTLCRLLRRLLHGRHLVQRNTRLQKMLHSPALAVAVSAVLLAGGAIAGAMAGGSGGPTAGGGGTVTQTGTGGGGHGKSDQTGGRGGGTAGHTGGNGGATADHPGGGGGGTAGHTGGDGGGTADHPGGGGRDGTVDQTAPQPTLISPRTNSFIADSTPTFKGNAGTAPGDLATVNIRIDKGSTIGSSPVETIEADVGERGSYSAPAPNPLSEGIYTARAEQSDQQNNPGASGPVTFTVDLTPPAVTILKPQSDSIVSPPVDLGGTAGHDPGDLLTVSIDIKPLNSSSLKKSRATTNSLAAATVTCDTQSLTARVATDGKWSVNSPPELAEPCRYTAVAMQRDEAGHEGHSEAVTFSTVSAGTG
jgi:hypothetical protein